MPTTELHRAPATVTNLFRDVQANLTVGIESNGKGVMGLIVDLPGGFVRGRNEAEAIQKVNTEAGRYLSWIGRPRDEREGRYRGFVVQRSHSSLSVEDGDCSLLLDVDRQKMRPDEFHALSDLVLYSGQTLDDLFRGAELKGWVDQARVRKTFYGACPSSIDEIFAHVKTTQAYYLSRLGLSLQQGEFMMMRRLALNLLRRHLEEQGTTMAPPPVEADHHELWTPKKVLRRFVLHDRIHGKTMSRIMMKQKQLGLISGYADPFRFSSPL